MDEEQEILELQAQENPTETVEDEEFLTEDEDIEDGDYGDSYEMDYGSDMADFDDD